MKQNLPSLSNNITAPKEVIRKNSFKSNISSNLLAFDPYLHLTTTLRDSQPLETSINHKFRRSLRINCTKLEVENPFKKSKMFRLKNGKLPEKLFPINKPESIASTPIGILIEIIHATFL